MLCPWASIALPSPFHRRSIASPSPFHRLSIASPPPPIAFDGADRPVITRTLLSALSGLRASDEALYGEAVQALGADVLALQEVFATPFLWGLGLDRQTKFVRRLEDMGYKYSCSCANIFQSFAGFLTAWQTLPFAIAAGPLPRFGVLSSEPPRRTCTQEGYRAERVPAGGERGWRLT